MTTPTSDDRLHRQLEIALDIAEDDRIRYHLREALQLQLAEKDRECSDEIENY